MAKKRYQHEYQPSTSSKGPSHLIRAIMEHAVKHKNLSVKGSVMQEATFCLTSSELRVVDPRPRPRHQPHATCKPKDDDEGMGKDFHVGTDEPDHRRHRSPAHNCAKHKAPYPDQLKVSTEGNQHSESERYYRNRSASIMAPMSFAGL
jgi:hypothetical protein